MKTALLNCTLFLLGINSALAAGGISGGGGTRTPKHPVSSEEVKVLINSSKHEITKYFNKLEIYFGLNNKEHCHLEICQKLFGGEKSIQSIIAETSVHLEEERPCLSPQGIAYDGYAPGPIENSICISVYNITKKVSKREARSEILALMAHEYTHLLGSTEEEAELLQEDILDAFYEVSAKDLQEHDKKFQSSIERIKDISTTALDSIFQSMKRREGLKNELGFEVGISGKTTLSNLLFHFRSILQASRERLPFSSLNWEKFVILEEAYIRVRNALDSQILASPNSYMNVRDYLEQEKIWKARTELPVKTLDCRVGNTILRREINTPCSTHPLPFLDKSILRCDSSSRLKKELDVIKSLVRKL